jgi:hypothetical protein
MVNTMLSQRDGGFLKAFRLDGLADPRVMCLNGTTAH